MMAGYDELYSTSQDVFEKKVKALDEEIKNREAKEQIAQRIAGRVQDGNVIGFGSGSTSYLTAIEKEFM